MSKSPTILEVIVRVIPRRVTLYSMVNIVHCRSSTFCPLACLLLDTESDSGGH